MIRTRQATLIVASGLLLANAGCLNLWDRLQCRRPGAGIAHGAPDCTCNDVTIPHGSVPTGLEGGPVLVQPDAAIAPPPPPPPGAHTPPLAPPPRIVPIPATPMPWQG